jgi:long-subunit acyl-CoA synthetase (AMP-forming)
VGLRDNVDTATPTMPTRIIDAFQRNARERPEAPALTFTRDGRWDSLRWREYHEQVRLAGRALIALGVAAGEHVTIIGFNCVEWFVADLAAIAAGAIPAGIYATNTAEQCQYVAHHCSTRVAFVENAEQLEKFRAIRDRLPSLAAIVVMREEPAGDDALSWAAFLELGRTVDDRRLDARIEAQHVDDVCTLIYTSGTTGVPKAVMLSHGNITWVIEQASRLVEMHVGDHIVSYLALSHVAEQLFSLHSNAVLGTSIWFADSLETVGDALRAARPHHFLAVPRVWEKMQAKMEAAGAANSGMKKRIVAWARRIGLDAGYAHQRGRRRPFLHSLADRLVYSKVRKALGLDRARTLVTGAAPISRHTLDFFLSLGLPILEVYGMSECTAITTCCTPQRYRTGKAGYVLPGTEVRIAPDGEICIRGPNVFKGYLGDPVATAAAIDAEGWLHSGDIGELDEDGFLQITDRKKELIITSGGENIPPQLVEGHLKSIAAVSQAVLIGDQRRYLAALITLDPDKVVQVAALAGSSARTAAEAATCEKFTAYLQREIDGVNRRLARVQTVKRFAVLDRELSVEGGELTPTMKLKRKVVSEKYAAVIERMYAE